jgi:hypothetical protein
VSGDQWLIPNCLAVLQVIIPGEKHSGKAHCGMRLMLMVRKAEHRVTGVSMTMPGKASL